MRRDGLTGQIGASWRHVQQPAMAMAIAALDQAVRLHWVRASNRPRPGPCGRGWLANAPAHPIVDPNQPDPGRDRSRIPASFAGWQRTIIRVQVVTHAGCQVMNTDSIRSLPDQWSNAQERRRANLSLPQDVLYTRFCRTPCRTSRSGRDLSLQSSERNSGLLVPGRRFTPPVRERDLSIAWKERADYPANPLVQR